MIAAFCSIVSALSQRPAWRHRVHRLVTMLALISTFLGVGAVRADAQEVIEYYGVDAIGSIRVVFAPDGTVKARSDYLPFGEEWAPATLGGPLPSQRFTGQQRDAEEGHDNFNARSYRTQHGRMTSVDPIFSGLFEPQRWNRYAYALNNPLSYHDPTGLQNQKIPPPMHRFEDSTGVVGKPGSAPGGGWGSGPLDDLYQWWMFGGGPEMHGWLGPIVNDPTANAGLTTDPDGNLRGSDSVTVEGGRDSDVAAASAVGVTGVLVTGALVEPTPIGEAAVVAVLAAAAIADKVYTEETKVHVTYILRNGAGQVYIGRTSGWGSPEKVMMDRFRGHERRLAGFGAPQLDRTSFGTLGGHAIRGREQQMIDFYGGVGHPMVANRIRGVGRWNIAAPYYDRMSTLAFGPPQ